MIQKPQAGWEKEGASVMGARAFLEAGGTIGENAKDRFPELPKMAVPLLLLMGLPLLRTMPADSGGDFAKAAIGLLPLLIMVYALRSQFRRHRQDAAEPRQQDMPISDALMQGQSPSQEMTRPQGSAPVAVAGLRTVSYSQQKLATRAAGLLLMAVLFALPLALAASVDPIRSVLCLGVVAGAAWQVLVTATKLFGKDLTALAWDDDDLRVETLYGSHRLAWRDIAAIEIQERKAGGAFDMWERRKLVISAWNISSLCKVRLPMSTLDLDERALADLMYSFAHRHDERLGDAGGIAMRLAEARAPLAAAPAPTQMPAARTFGRRGTEEAAIAPAMPAPAPMRKPLSVVAFAQPPATTFDAAAESPATIRVVRGGISPYEIQRKASRGLAVILCAFMALVWAIAAFNMICAGAFGGLLLGLMALGLAWLARWMFRTMLGRGHAPASSGRWLMASLGDTAQTLPLRSATAPTYVTDAPGKSMSTDRDDPRSIGAFDPDAIMERYLAERLQASQVSQAAPIEQSAPKSFGRKIA